jgi:hypothetical protein
MWSTLRDELWELLWLASLVSGLSVLAAGLAAALAVVLVSAV